jgi:hypothetical protein
MAGGWRYYEDEDDMKVVATATPRGRRRRQICTCMLEDDNQPILSAQLLSTSALKALR